MKKKFKLFTTIAALSLSLGLMVFGIWAAASVNVTISSNVSYTADGVAFNLYGKSEALASQPTGDITPLDEESADQTLTVDVTNAGSGNMTLPDRDFSTTNTWVVYTFTIENIGSNVIGEVTVDATCSHANIALTQDDTSSITLNNGETASFRVYLHLTNENQTITGQPVEIEISIGEATTYELRYEYNQVLLWAPLGLYLEVNGVSITEDELPMQIKVGDVLIANLLYNSEGGLTVRQQATVGHYSSTGSLKSTLGSATSPEDLNVTITSNDLEEGDYFLLTITEVEDVPEGPVVVG